MGAPQESVALEVQMELEVLRVLFGRMPLAEALDCATAAGLDAVERWA
jgi:hypothetical protein